MIVTQPDRVLLSQQVNRFAFHLTGTVLDVGGGDGRRYRESLRNAATYQSLDLNEALHPDIIGSAENIPLSANSIDSILCTQVLEHVPYPERVLAEIHRVLKPGGKALITVPQLNELHEEPHDYFRYTCFGLKRMLHDAGFQVTALEQRGSYYTCMAQLRIRRWIDRLQPYRNKWALWFLGPISLLYTRAAILLDHLDTHASTRKHAIGWAVVVEKTAS